MDTLRARPENPPRSRHQGKIQKYTRGGESSDTTRSSFTHGSQFVPGIFVDRQLPVGRNVGPARQASLSPFGLRSTREKWRWLHAFRSATTSAKTEGGKCSRKISGIPDTIGSTRPVARKGIHQPSSPTASPPRTYPLLYFGPTMAHLNLISRTFPLANFAFFPFVPFLARAKWKRHRKPSKKGNFFGNVACETVAIHGRVPFFFPRVGKCARRRGIRTKLKFNFSRAIVS